MPELPNILFIFTDQQRADTMACYSNELIDTPNLNALAEQSFVFENAYVSAPICTPSRSTIMTGTWPHTNGCIKNNAPLDSSIPTIADLLPDEYHTAYFGKWHLGNEVIRRHDFDEWVSIEDYYRRYYSDPRHLDVLSDHHRFLTDRGIEPDGEAEGVAVFSRKFAAALPEELTKASFLSTRAADFIRANSHRPFALYLNFLEPHPPYNGPLNDMYDPISIPVSPTFMKDPPPNAGPIALMRSKASLLGDGMDDDPAGPYDELYWRSLIARYWGNVTLMDRAVGRVLSVLDEAGIADSTIVVFTSEHGDQLGEHNVIGKAVFYEQSVRVPLLMRVPWLTRSQTRIEGRYSHIDTVPTLLDLVGATLPDHLQGQSRLTVLTGEHTLDSSDVVIDWTGFAVAPMDGFPELDRVQNTQHRALISSDGWKLILGQEMRGELYDLNSDPFEETNLFDEPRSRPRIRDMMRRLEAWQFENGDTLDLSGVL